MNQQYIKMIIQLITLFILAPSFFYAQSSHELFPELKIVPSPRQDAFFADYNDYSNIKEIRSVVKVGQKRATSDTLQIRHFNEKGLKVKSVRYDNNKPSSTTISKYNADGKLLSWETFEEHHSTLVMHFYDSKKQLVKNRKYKIVRSGENADSSEILTTDYTYDEAGMMTHFQSSAFGEKRYKYTDGKLSTNTGGFISQEFEYDVEGNIYCIRSYLGKEINASRKKGLSKYYYDASNLLVSDSIQDNSYGSFQTSQYEYYANGQLKRSIVHYDTLYRNNEFVYENGKLKEVIIQTNGSSAYLKLDIDFRLSAYYSFPLEYRVVFEYDDFRNRTSRKTFVNGELYGKVVYDIVYRE